MSGYGEDITKTAKEKRNEEPCPPPENVDQMCQRKESEESGKSISGRFVGTIFEEHNLSAIDNGSKRTVASVHDVFEKVVVNKAKSREEGKFCCRDVIRVLAS